MSICVSHTKSAAVPRKRGIGYMKALWFKIIEAMWSRFLYPFFSCGREKDIYYLVPENFDRKLR